MAASGRRLLVLAFDPLTETMPGPAIRAWHLAAELAGSHQVILAGTAGATRRHEAMTVVAAEDPDQVRSLVGKADAVVAPTSAVARYRFLEHLDAPLCIDMYIPTHLENLEAQVPGSADEHAHAVAHQVDVLNADLRRADFILCASERQRDFWLGALGALGRLNPATYKADPALRRLIDVVPFGVDPRPAPVDGGLLRRMFPAISAGDPVVVWGGGVYNWFDPLTVVEAVDLLRRSRPRIRLVFIGLRHPNPGVPEMSMVRQLRARSDALGLTGSHVFFNEGWLPYDDRGEVLAGADVGVSTHADHVEARFSFRTRVLDYLWAGLPSVLTEGDTLSEAIAAAGLGVAVGPGQVGEVAAGIAAMLDRPPPRERVRDFGRSYAWPVVAGPLLSWAADPQPAPDRVAAAAPPPAKAAMPEPGTPPGAPPSVTPAAAGRPGVPRAGRLSQRLRRFLGS